VSKETSHTPGRVIRFSRSFNILFSAVFFLTLFSALAAMWLSCKNPATELQKDLFKYFCVGWQSGFGAILGLIGGKMTK